MTETLAQRIHRTCHLTGSFTLRSGLISDEYFDKFLFESDPVLLREVAGVMAGLLPAGTEVIAGMEMGGIPVVTALSQVTGLPAVFVRKEAKTYGTCKLAEGIAVGGRRVVGVEDVVTRAGALLAGCLELRKLGAILDTAVCVIDRDQGGAANLAAEGIILRAALSRAELDAAASR
ncbi:MAG TPA: orotate phosphoribosyltransferase [Mycobacteriales bacterium]|nr:orotate phosphoribosyltransferase [Mycobacteriales bacterium]